MAALRKGIVDRLKALAVRYRLYFSSVSFAGIF
jgi:hypothetical protein